MKKCNKVALIVDVENWAFWNIASQIKANSSKNFEYEIICLEYFPIVGDLFFYLKKFDLVHFFWRGALFCLDNVKESEYGSYYGLDYEMYNRRILQNLLVTTSVYDHLFLDSEGIKITNIALKYCKNYSVSSNLLNKIYNEEEEIIKKPMTVITDGVELTKFVPKNLERFDNMNKREVVIGWVGNSAWNGKEKDNKGVNTILKPAIEELIKEGYKIKMYFADKQERFIPHSEMPNYYNDIDVLVCSSLIEGTPNPVLEAASCGVPIVSTNVGIVPDVLGKKQKEFILKNRTIQDMKSTLKKLIDNKKMFKELSEENLKSIKKWDWKNKVKQFEDFFQSNIDLKKGDKK